MNNAWHSGSVLSLLLMKVIKYRTWIYKVKLNHISIHLYKLADVKKRFGPISLNFHDNSSQVFLFFFYFSHWCILPISDRKYLQNYISRTFLLHIYMQILAVPSFPLLLWINIPNIVIDSFVLFISYNSYLL